MDSNRVSKGICFQPLDIINKTSFEDWTYKFYLYCELLILIWLIININLNDKELVKFFLDPEWIQKL